MRLVTVVEASVEEPLAVRFTVLVVVAFEVDAYNVFMYVFALNVCAAVHELAVAVFAPAPPVRQVPSTEKQPDVKLIPLAKVDDAVVDVAVM